MNTAPPHDTAGGGDPVGLAEAVRLVLVAVVAAGWTVIPDDTINIVVSMVGVLGSIVSTVLARRKVVPFAMVDASGTRPGIDPLYAEDVPRTPKAVRGRRRPSGEPPPSVPVPPPLPPDRCRHACKDCPCPRH